MKTPISAWVTALTEWITIGIYSCLTPHDKTCESAPAHDLLVSLFLTLTMYMFYAVGIISGGRLLSR